MKRFYGEDFICPECLWKGDPQKVFENLWDKDGCKSIIYVCPSCERTSIVGEICGEEEFYY